MRSMDRWIRWTTKTGTSLWHRAPPAKTYIRTVRGPVRIELEQGELVEPPSRVVRSPSFEAGTVYRYTACGFRVPPFERLEEWTGVTLPPLPRCIWCLHRWIVDTAPPSGAPPAQGGSARSIVIRVRGKKPPTQHA
jgi:hypothetical protein